MPNVFKFELVPSKKLICTQPKPLDSTLGSNFFVPYQVQITLLTIFENLFLLEDSDDVPQHTMPSPTNQDSTTHQKTSSFANNWLFFGEVNDNAHIETKTEYSKLTIVLRKIIPQILIFFI